jgi:E3 SUMO-protein ligase PIAS1
VSSHADSRSPVIQNAIHQGDAEALRRLLYRVQNHGDTPTGSLAPTSSSPPATSYTHPPPPPTNGYSMANGYQSNASYPAYQQPQIPPSTPLNPSTCQATY